MKYIISESQYNFLLEGKYDSITSEVVRDIMSEVKHFIDSDETEEVIDLATYETPNYFGYETEFEVELILKKQKRKNYKIDADSPGDKSDSEITIMIYLPNENATKLLKELYFDLIYVFRHELEHWLQVVSDYKRVSVDEPTNIPSALFKKVEIEPQIAGYYLKAKKEKRSFEDVAREHIKKLIKNRQYKFGSSQEMDELISLLKSKAREMKLNV